MHILNTDVIPGSTPFDESQEETKVLKDQYSLLGNRQQLWPCYFPEFKAAFS